MKALSEASAPPGSQIYFTHAKQKRAGARVHVCTQRCGAEWWGWGGAAIKGTSCFSSFPCVSPPPSSSSSSSSSLT